MRALNVNHCYNIYFKLLNNVKQIISGILRTPLKTTSFPNDRLMIFGAIANGTGIWAASHARGIGATVGVLQGKG